MRKAIHSFIFLVFAALACGPAAAQHYFGARVGTGSGTSRFYPQRDMGSVWGLWSGGVSWKYYSAEKYLGGLEVDLLLMQQGFRRYDENIMGDFGFPGDTTGYEQRKVNSVMLPIFWQPHVYMFQQRMRVFMNLGLTFSYNMSSRRRVASKLNGTVEDVRYPMLTVRDNRFGYGLVGGAGVSWAVDRIEIFGEVRYYIGYADILKNYSKYPANPLRSPLDGLQISIGAYYRFGRGGILSQPSSRVAGRVAERMRNRAARRTVADDTDE